MKKISKKLFSLYIFILIAITILSSCNSFSGSNLVLPSEDQIISDLQRMYPYGTFRSNPDKRPYQSVSNLYKYIEVYYIYSDDDTEINGTARYEYTWAQFGFSATPKYESDFYYKLYKSDINNKLAEEAKKYFNYSDPEIKVFSENKTNTIMVPVSERNLNSDNFLKNYYSSYNLTDAIIIKKPEEMTDNLFSQKCYAAAKSLKSNRYFKQHKLKLYKASGSDFSSVNNINDTENLTLILEINN